MAATFLCIPALPASSAAGWKAPPGMGHGLSYAAELLPGISPPSLETVACIAAWIGVIPGS